MSKQRQMGAGQGGQRVGGLAEVVETQRVCRWQGEADGDGGRTGHG